MDFSHLPRVIYFKEKVPTPVCIVISLICAMIFQFNGGVFLPTAYQMSSALGWIQEDVMMAGYASFIGMTIIFPILIRLKFRFTTRSILMTVCPILIICNIIAINVHNQLILIITCFISGFFRMWGTFECFSNIRLTVTPSGNFSVFYPVIYIVVLESIQVSGIVAMHLTDLANWQYMHYFVICLLLVAWITLYMLTRHIRKCKLMPLYGIDWTSAVIWTIMLFSVVFICIYGEYFDWFYSWEIRIAAVIAVVAILININRMASLKRPYIEFQTLRYKNFPIVLLLFLMLCLNQTTSSVLQNLLMSRILNYDNLNSISINWFAFAGILCGSATVFYRKAILKKGFKMLIFIGFLLVVIYQYYMYFLIYPDLNIESLYFPNFLRGLGHGILYISLTIYIALSVPFKHFFQALCVLSFIRTSIATPLGTAILNRWMRLLQVDKIGIVGRDIDKLHEWMPNAPIKELYAEVNRQATMVSMKELFGWVCIQGTIILLIIIGYRIWELYKGENKLEFSDKDDNLE